MKEPAYREHIELIARSKEPDGQTSYRKIAMPDGYGGWLPAEWMTKLGKVTFDNWWSKSVESGKRRTVAMFDSLPAGQAGALLIRIDKETNRPANLLLGLIPEEDNRKPSDMPLPVQPHWDTREEFATVRTVKEGGEYFTLVELADGRRFHL